MAKKLRTKKNKKMISWWGWMVGVKLAFSKFCSKKIENWFAQIRRFTPKKIGFGFVLRIQFYIFWYRNQQMF